MGDLIYQGTTTCKWVWEEVSMMPKYVLLEYHSFGQYPRITISMATAKLAIFLQNIRWESCLKLNFEQLSLDVQNQQCRGGKTPAIQQ